MKRISSTYIYINISVEHILYWFGQLLVVSFNFNYHNIIGEIAARIIQNHVHTVVDNGFNVL